MTVWLFVLSAKAAITRKTVGNFEPGDPFLVKPVPVRSKAIRIIEGADMELDD